MVLKSAHEHIFNDEENDHESIIVDPKVTGYAEEIVPYFNDQQFKIHFRMCPRTFEQLLKMVYSVADIQTVGQPQVEHGKQLMVTVWFLANLECLRYLPVSLKTKYLPKIILIPI